MLCELTQRPLREFSCTQVIVKKVAFEPVLKSIARFLCDEVFERLQSFGRDKLHLRSIKLAVCSLDTRDQQPALLSPDRVEHTAREVWLQNIRCEHTPVFSKAVAET